MATRTTEEGFLHELLERPGDDAPRLVYADWLEERGDPRADYLRAEVARARRPGRRAEAKARKLAAGLDAVWVARVSRPPLGVCCDHVRFTRGGPPRTPADLDAAEARLGARLPPDFRAFLLNYNGGVPAPAHAPDPRYEPPAPRCLMVGVFYRSLGGTGDGDVEHELRFMRSIHREYSSAGPFPAEGLLPVASTLYDLGCLLVGIAPANFGRVIHFTDWARSMEYPGALADLAPSFADLLGRLGPDLDD